MVLPSVISVIMLSLEGKMSEYGQHNGSHCEHMRFIKFSEELDEPAGVFVDGTLNCEISTQMND